jgi:polyhydroxyalkanoate synthesis regulator phasin
MVINYYSTNNPGSGLSKTDPGELNKEEVKKMLEELREEIKQSPIRPQIRDILVEDINTYLKG